MTTGFMEEDEGMVGWGGGEGRREGRRGRRGE